MLTEQLKKQIEQEANKSASRLFNNHSRFIARTEYALGAERYAEKWQPAEQRAERYEKALKEIQSKAKSGIFPHLPVETVGAQMCIEIDQYITDLFTPKPTTDDTDNKKGAEL